MPNIGLVGCGRWGRLVLRDLLSLGATVSVVASGDNARLAKAAGAEVVVGSPRDLPSTDGLVIATPTPTHADVIEALLPRGVPIYCEKPLCDDAARARRLAAAGRDRLFVMDKWRYHQGVLELAAIARSGELGPVIGLRTTRVGYGHGHPETDCTWTLLPHDLCIAQEILGRLLPPQRLVTLLCRDGVATLEDAYADHLVMVANPPPGGTIAEPRTTRRPIPVEMPLLAELAAFVDHLNGGPPPRSSAAEAAETVAAIVEIRRLAAI